MRVTELNGMLSRCRIYCAKAKVYSSRSRPNFWGFHGRLTHDLIAREHSLWLTWSSWTRVFFWRYLVFFKPLVTFRTSVSTQTFIPKDLLQHLKSCYKSFFPTFHKIWQKHFTRLFGPFDKSVKHKKRVSQNRSRFTTKKVIEYLNKELCSERVILFLFLPLFSNLLSSFFSSIFLFLSFFLLVFSFLLPFFLSSSF